MASASIRLDDELIESAMVFGKASNRSAPKQIESWARIGQMLESNPELSFSCVQQSLIAQAEVEAGMVESYVLGS